MANQAVKFYLNQTLFFFVGGLFLLTYGIAKGLGGYDFSGLIHLLNVSDNLGVFVFGVPALAFVASPGTVNPVARKWVPWLSAGILVILTYTIVKLVYFSKVDTYMGFEQLPESNQLIYFSVYSFSLLNSVLVLFERFFSQEKKCIYPFVFLAALIGSGLSIFWLQLTQAIFGGDTFPDALIFLGRFAKELSYSAVFVTLFFRLEFYIEERFRSYYHAVVGLAGFLYLMGFNSIGLSENSSEWPLVIGLFGFLVAISLFCGLIIFILPRFFRGMSKVTEDGTWLIFWILIPLLAYCGTSVGGLRDLYTHGGLLDQVLPLVGLLVLPSIILLVLDRPKPSSVVNMAFFRALFVCGISVTAGALLRLSPFVGNFVHLKTPFSHSLFSIAFVGLAMMALGICVLAWDKVLHRLI